MRNVAAIGKISAKHDGSGIQDKLLTNVQKGIRCTL